MTALHIISGILLIIACVAIILVVLFTDTNESGLNSAISGGSSDTFFGKNAKNTREAKLDKATKICVAIFFVVALLVNIVAAIWG